MNQHAHKTEGVNRTKTVWFYPFVSTGKEKDEETGYGYFGARYMDHELMTMWLSVGPMADKYPSISPYAYCALNPVKIVDPGGMDTFNVDIANGRVVRCLDNSNGKDVVSIFKNQEHIFTRTCDGGVEIHGSNTSYLYEGRKNYTHGLKFQNTNDGKAIFEIIWRSETSDVEWDYYIETSQNNKKNGLLITSGIYDRLYVPQSIFSGEILEWHHLHPYNKNICTSINNKPFIPSLEDVKKVFSFNKEEQHVRCMLYFNGGSYEFSDWNEQKYLKYTDTKNNFYNHQKRCFEQ